MVLYNIPTTAARLEGCMCAPLLAGVHAAEVCGLMQHVGRSVAATSSTEVRTAEQAEKVIQCGYIVSRLNRIIAAVFSTYITLKRSRTGREYSMLYTRACEPGRDVDRHAQTHNTPRLLKLIV